MWLIAIAKRKFGFDVIAGGDTKQIPSASPGNTWDLTNNEFILHEIFDGNNIHLPYNPSSGRYLDNTTDYLDELWTTRQIPRIFKANADIVDGEYNLDFYLTTRNADGAKRISREIAVYKASNLSDHVFDYPNKTHVIWCKDIVYFPTMPIVLMIMCEILTDGHL